MVKSRQVQAVIDALRREKDPCPIAKELIQWMNHYATEEQRARLIELLESKSLRRARKLDEVRRRVNAVDGKHGLRIWTVIGNDAPRPPIFLNLSERSQSDSSVETALMALKELLG